MLRIEIGYVGEGGYKCYWLLYTERNGYFVEIKNPNIVKKTILHNKETLKKLQEITSINNIFELKTDTSSIGLFDPRVFFISVYDNGDINQFAIIQPVLRILPSSYGWEKRLFEKTNNYSNIINAMFEISRDLEL